jgi:WD40 repeat protein
LPTARDRHDVDQTLDLTFSPNGAFLLGGTRDGGVFQWDIAASRFVRAYPRGRHWGYTVFSSVAMSQDGKLVAAGLAQREAGATELHNERGIKVYDAASGRLLYSLDGHEGNIGAVTFSADDRCCTATIGIVLMAVSGQHHQSAGSAWPGTTA